MSTASAQQRALVASHTGEEQARIALLNIVRDARASHTHVVTANSLTLTAFHDVRGENVTITYTWPIAANNPDYYLAANNRQLTRTVSIPVGNAPNEWNNPFSDVLLRELNLDTATLGRIGIELVLWMPVVGSTDGLTLALDAGGNPELTADGEPLQIWEINSAVATRRMPL
jgi:hypothetical protein